MSAAQFPVIAGPDDPRWGEAMRRGRIEANAILSAIRQKLSSQRGAVVARETHTLEVSGSIPLAASNLPQACGSGTNDVGGGLSAGVAAKVIESVGPARGQFGADKCMPTTQTNGAFTEAATAAEVAPNSGAPCHAPESNFTAPAARPAEGASATVEHDCASGGRRGEQLPAPVLPQEALGAVNSRNATGGAQDSISA